MMDEFSPQGRAGLATFLLMQNERGYSPGELAERLGYRTPEGVYHLMSNLSQARVPVYYDYDLRVWRIDRES